MARFHDVSEEDLGSAHVFPKTWISESGSVVSDSLWPHGLYSPWNSPDQNTGVEYSLSLLQRIFPTQGLNPGLPQYREILYQLSHKGSPRILEWVAYPFSIRSSQPRNWTGVSCIAGGFFTAWATREALDDTSQTLCRGMGFWLLPHHPPTRGIFPAKQAWPGRGREVGRGGAFQ